MDSNLRVRAAIPIKKMQFDDIIKIACIIQYKDNDKQIY
jgi:hypothetical protein